MDKQIKLYIGIGLLGVGAYLYWKSTQPKANALGRPRSCPKGWTLSSDGTKCVRSTTPITAKGVSKKPKRTNTGYGGSGYSSSGENQTTGTYTVVFGANSSNPYGHDIYK